MTYPENFADAHDRHWRDAEFLFQGTRWANADHLYGLSAECGLKKVLQVEGQPIAGPYRTHVDRLWPVFQTFIQGRTGAGHLSKFSGGTPFNDWRIDQRYVHGGNFNELTVRPHRDAARAIRVMVQHAIQGGQP